MKLPKQLIFVLGGARSGKSAFAEQLARNPSAGSGGRVLYVATAEALDEEMRHRIDAHRRQRPASWDTLEEPLSLVTSLGSRLYGNDGGREYDTCLLDCLTLWISNQLLAREGDPSAEREILATAGELLEVYEKSAATWIVVSNEVGLSVVPATPLGRTFRDVQGRVNQMFAARADRAYLMVAGLAMDLKAIGAVPFTSLVTSPQFGMRPHLEFPPEEGRNTEGEGTNR